MIRLHHILIWQILIFGPLTNAILKMIAIYAVGVIATFSYNKLLIKVTQGSLKEIRDTMFEHMEKLPIRYFDTHNHGDIMSIYTNDTDTLRQMISQKCTSGYCFSNNDRLCSCFNDCNVYSNDDN